MLRVLASPTEYEITDEDYGKTYNLLDNLRGDDISVDAHVGRCAVPLNAENVRVQKLGGRNRLSYYGRAFRQTARDLRSGSFDVYHHMNLSYRWFNPVLLTQDFGEVPVVVGPCQAGHAILGEEFNRMVGHALGVDIPRSVTDPLHYVVEGLRDITVDPLRMELFKRTLNTADKIICVHEEAKSKYTDFVPSSKIEVIPLGVSPDEFKFTERSDSMSIVAIGHLRQRKGYDVLLKALDQVQKQCPEAHLNIFGKGPLESELRELTAEMNLENHVTFHGYVDQEILKEHLANARVFVHPSRSESFSLVRLEAMASGCPVVVTDIDGAGEMVRDGTDGYIVPSESPSSIAERLLDILGDIDLARKMGQNARVRVEEKYDWEQIGRQYVDVYRSLI